jgi:hypothetical protein
MVMGLSISMNRQLNNMAKQEFKKALKSIVQRNGCGGPGIIKSNFNSGQKKQMSGLGIKFSSKTGGGVSRTIMKSGKKRKSLGFSSKGSSLKKAKVKSLVLKSRNTGKVTKLPSLKTRKPVFS